MKSPETALQEIEERISGNHKETADAVKRLTVAEQLYKDSSANYEQTRKKRQMALAKREETKDLDKAIRQAGEEKDRLEDEIAGLKTMIDALKAEGQGLQGQVMPLKRKIVIETKLSPLVEEYNTLAGQLAVVLEKLERSLFFEYGPVAGPGNPPVVFSSRITGGSALDAVPALWTEGPEQRCLYERRALMEQLMREHKTNQGA